MDLSFLKGTRIIALDIETTCLSIQKAFVRELGAAEFIDGKYVRGSSALFSGGRSDPGALKCHKITDESVTGKPTFMEKAGAFSNFISAGGKRPADILGHNVQKYDIPIIKRFVYGAGYKMAGNGPNGDLRIIDTLVICRTRFQFASNRLEDLCKMFGIKHGGHRALGDVKCNWELFLKLVELMDCTNYEDLITSD